MNQYWKHSIVTHAWHEFLYGYSTEERKIFLKSMEEDYPIAFDGEEASAIYVDHFSLPLLPTSKKIDSMQASFIAREHLDMVIASSIIEKTMRDVDEEIVEARMTSFLETMNRLKVSKENVSSLKEFLLCLRESFQFYEDMYQKLVIAGSLNENLDSVSISFLDLSMFLPYYKRALGMKKHFSLILDQNPANLLSKKAVNSIINRRIAGDLAIKVASEPDDWQIYTDLNGSFIENVHDYGVVPLDDSYQVYIKKMKNI